MARLIFAAQTSADGCIADANGDFAWAAPDDDVLAAINDLERRLGTFLYGRRLYGPMAFWETYEAAPDQPLMREFGEIWRGADKIVYSTTLPEVTTARTRLERTFDPSAIRAMKETSERDLSVGGPGLAAHALRAGLVDEVRMFVYPLTVGGGTRMFPDDLRLDLRLLGDRRFPNGVVYLRYAVSYP
ncbi:MAG TPA: dihydrofolate reductase family protein [Actinoplanes sp.]|jgi:dihydrofolate reductase